VRAIRVKSRTDRTGNSRNRGRDHLRPTAPISSV